MRSHSWLMKWASLFSTGYSGMPGYFKEWLSLLMG